MRSETQRLTASVTTLGELTASIAHEVNQPIAGVVANAEACLRWLDRETPDLDGARRSVELIISDGNRASEVIRRVRALANKTGLEKAPLDIDDVIREAIPLVQGELISHQVWLRMELASNLPMIPGDRVQLQQVIINLVMNGIEAMQSVGDHQIQRHGYGTLDLPFDHGSPRGTTVGHGKRTPRCHVSVHPAGERRYYVVRLRPSSVQSTGRSAPSSAPGQTEKISE